MISVTILVKNGARRLGAVLESVRSFEEVVVYDTGSTDTTLEIARSYPFVTLYQGAFTGFGASRNRAAAHARHEWILSVDADEVLSPELVEEIKALALDPGTLYALPFRNYYRERWIKGCGWYPESHIRLYHKGRSAFSEALVHEGVSTKGLRIEQLSAPVLHYSYDSISDFLLKMERYSTLFAQQYRHRRRSSPATACLHGAFAFVKSYLLQRGFLDGFPGFLISMYKGHTAFYKYLKLYQENKCS